MLDESYYDERTKKIYIKHNIYVSGKDNLDRWIKTIGFSNPVHLTKFQIWDKFGFCPPKTTLRERLKILNGELDIGKSGRSSSIGRAPAF